MKTKVLFCMCLLMTLFIPNLKAQDDLGIDEGLNPRQIFSFTCPLAEGSKIGDDYGISLGASAGVLLNEKFYIGAYGYKLANTSNTFRMNYMCDDSVGRDLKLSFGHVGLLIGYYHNQENPVHWGITSKFGMGTVSLIDDGYGYYAKKYMTNNVYVVTPQLELVFDLSDWIKFNLGVGYRYTINVKNKAYSESAFNSPVISLSFVFGKFRETEE
ncbi:MAG: hypothetical protein PHD97_00445 [Bacteroidales bacterium]|nr:hypothetical protein [Bacteroidales bacterium]